jgi:hypothetical protein
MWIVAKKAGIRRNGLALEWLKKSALEVSNDKEQGDLHAAAEKCLGTLSGLGPATADRVRETVRKRVRDRIEKNQRKTDSSLCSE